MSDISDLEARHLIQLPKQSELPQARPFPSIGGRLEIPVRAIAENELFSVNINRGRTSSVKVTYHTRARATIPLVRLDFGAEHQNPDGVRIGSPHLHIYTEGFADKWAYELDKLPNGFRFTVSPNASDQEAWFNGFLDFCHISHDNTINWNMPRLL